jgi:hypothetical protein
VSETWATGLVFPEVFEETEVGIHGLVDGVGVAAHERLERLFVHGDAGFVVVG